MDDKADQGETKWTSFDGNKSGLEKPLDVVDFIDNDDGTYTIKFEEEDNYMTFNKEETRRIKRHAEIAIGTLDIVASIDGLTPQLEKQKAEAQDILNKINGFNGHG